MYGKYIIKHLTDLLEHVRKQEDVTETRQSMHIDRFYGNFRF